MNEFINECIDEFRMEYDVAFQVEDEAGNAVVSQTSLLWSREQKHDGKKYEVSAPLFPSSKCKRLCISRHVLQRMNDAYT